MWMLTAPRRWWPAPSRAEELIILTNVPGLMRNFPDESTLIAHLPKNGLEQAISFAEGRMKKKVLGASEAFELGVPKVIFADGRIDHPLLDALAGKGTLISETQSTSARNRLELTHEYHRISKTSTPLACTPNGPSPSFAGKARICGTRMAVNISTVSAVRAPPTSGTPTPRWPRPLPPRLPR